MPSLMDVLLIKLIWTLTNYSSDNLLFNIYFIFQMLWRNEWLWETVGFDCITMKNSLGRAGVVNDPGCMNFLQDVIQVISPEQLHHLDIQVKTFNYVHKWGNVPTNLMEKKSCDTVMDSRQVILFFLHSSQYIIYLYFFY